MIYKKNDAGFLIEKMSDGFEIPSGESDRYYTSDDTLDLRISHGDIWGWRWHIGTNDLRAENSFLSAYVRTPSESVIMYTWINFVGLPTGYVELTAQEISAHVLEKTKIAAIEKVEAYCQKKVGQGIVIDNRTFDTDTHDQINIMALYTSIKNNEAPTQIKLSYYQDGTYCHTSFTNDDTVAIALVIRDHIKNLLDLTRGVKVTIRAAATASEINDALALLT